MNRALEQGAYQAEFRAQWPDGSLHPLAVRGKLFRDERGRPASLLGVLWDCSAQKAHEDALLREKTFTRALLDNLVEGVVACDERGVVVLINRTLREWQGRDALDLGQTQAADHAELLDPDGATPMASGSTPLARAFHGQAFRDLGMVIAARGRSPRHVLCNGTPILDPMGRRLGAVVVEHDVTERRRAGEAMRRIMVAVEQSPITVVITDAQGNIEYVNPTFSQLTGYSAAEVIGRNPRILNAGEAPAESYRKLWATILAGETWKGEFHNRKKNGELFWEAATIAPIRDSEGRITSFVALKEDITEAKRNEQARVESEIRFRELFETTKDGIAMTDPEGRYQDCNQAFLDLLGLDSKADLVGRSYEAFTPAEYLEGERRLIAEARVADDGRCHDFEKEYLRPSGERVPVEVRGWIRRDRDRQAIGIWAMARDITERVQARRALEQLNGELEERIRRRTSLLESANAELDAFSYSVSHDLRAPLRGIDGFSAALLEECGDQLGDEARHYLQRVRAGTQRMGLLIDDLLKLSRVSRGPLDLQPLDLGAMARGLVAELRQADPGRSLDLRVEPDLTAGGDHGLVRSVLENLLGNAWKYTAKVPAPRIELFRAALPDGSPGFCVRDNGAGFDMAYAGKLFTAFQRLHPSHEFEGSGIGLAIVQRIIRRHGGQVWAQGAVGEGASFFFSLPEPP